MLPCGVTARGPMHVIVSAHVVVVGAANALVTSACASTLTAGSMSTAGSPVLLSLGQAAH